MLFLVLFKNYSKLYKNLKLISRIINISGSITTPSQAHFHMETLTALVIPEEDSQLTIYASSQNSSALQVRI